MQPVADPPGRSVYVGADLGTSGLKLVAADAGGVVLAEAEASYPVGTPRPGWAESEPAAWLGALRAALREVAPALRGARVAGLGVDGQMHGLVLSDEAGAPLRPAILWPDRRADPVLPHWRDLPLQVRARLANPLAAGMTGPILDWLAAREPDAVARAERVLLPKDWVRLQLAGPAVTDPSDASGTLLWDVTTDGWALDVIRQRGLPARLLPDVVASDAVVGTTDLAALSGHADLAAADDVPVVTGCADTPAALLALGGLADGVVQVVLGTGAQVLQAAQEPPREDPEPITHVYRDAGDGWYRMVAVQNAGLALDRVRSLLALSWEELFSSAEAVPPGAGGVSFLPFLTGERGGIASPASRGGWLGIDDRTTRADLARAAWEAVLFAVRRAVELLPAPPDRVRLSGGGTRHPLVPRTLAALLQVPVDRVAARSASAAGAAVLAARAQGTTVAVATGGSARYEPEDGPGLESAYERWRDRLGCATSSFPGAPSERCYS